MPTHKLGHDHRSITSPLPPRLNINEYRVRVRIYPASVSLHADGKITHPVRSGPHLDIFPGSAGNAGARPAAVER